MNPADSTPEGATPAEAAAAEEPVKKAAPSKAPSTRKAAGSAKKAAGTAKKAPAKASARTKGASTKAAAPTKAASAQAQAPAGDAASGQETGSTKLSPTATTTKTPAPSATAWLRVTQVRSAIGTKPKHRGTLGALGLRGIGRTNLLPDRPEIRGMLARVPHLVEVASVDYDQKG